MKKRGQLKIQQMAFVLVALMIFFGIVLLIFAAVYLSGLKQNAQRLNDQGASELVRQIASSPELAFTSVPGKCTNCVDLDKALMLKNRTAYKGFWNLDFLQIVRVYPSGTGECTRANYPNCQTITLINKTIGTPAQAYVSLCHWVNQKGGYFSCSLGKIYASVRNIQANG